MEPSEEIVVFEHRETAFFGGTWVVWFDRVRRDGRRTTGFNEISPMIHRAIKIASAAVGQ